MVLSFGSVVTTADTNRATCLLVGKWLLLRHQLLLLEVWVCEIRIVRLVHSCPFLEITCTR